MNIIDIVIILMLALGAFIGFKKGGIRSIISLIGSILVIVLSYYLKNPLSVFLYENFPFKSFGGIFNGISSLNILVYEAIAYTICFIVLSIILKIIIKVSGIFDKLINVTIVFSLPSKLLGLILGFLQYFLLSFILVFVLNLIPDVKTKVDESMLGNKILYKTPILSDFTKNITNTINEIYEKCLKINKFEDGVVDLNYESLDILLKYNIIDVEGVKELHNKGKLNIENIDKLIIKYEVKHDKVS